MAWNPSAFYDRHSKRIRSLSPVRERLCLKMKEFKGVGMQLSANVLGSIPSLLVMESMLRGGSLMMQEKEGV